ncbi:hypothetical protein [Furfurilactobacillus milii]|uniref:Lipoprotein n=1 Tax=Furfurilactobacillus rossiae TaxID=231049 RepID=A0A7C9MRU9_9LACO|nr:hypothetical protein [Furfurilactobacillus milii]MYV06043.1 hypothetical protein [Furfurilactobacillus milii]
MKKTVVLLVSTASLLMLTACGNSSNEQNSGAATNKSERVVKHSKTNVSSHADSSTSDASQDSNQNGESANDNDQTDAFIQAPWTFATASSFLQKVDSATPEGSEHIGLERIDLGQAVDSSSCPISKLPGNSIYISENNKSGIGDGGFVLTKNSNRTVTIIEGSGAMSEPFEKLVVDAKSGHILSTQQLSGYDNMFAYFGIDVSNDDQANSDNQSDTDSTDDDSSDSVSDDSQSNDDSDSNDDTSDSQSSEDDSSSQDSNNSVSVDSDNVDSNDNGD